MSSLTMLLVACCLASVAVAASAQPATPAAGEGDRIGATEVLKWKDGKEAAFLLQFDDSAPSHVTTVIPELQKRGFVGTFYINPGNAHFKAHGEAWAAAARSPYVRLANHTFTHVGATDVEQARRELVRCNEVIRELTPADRHAKLVAFARPGGRPWDVPKEETDRLLTEQGLVRRPAFSGPMLTQKTVEAMVATVDAALAEGEMGHLDFHGVGGDWHAAPVEWFIAVLDRLDRDRDRLWITDAASWHQYIAERDAATVTVVRADDEAIRVSLTATTDPALYDLPLTLRTRVPAAWTTCRVTQGGSETVASTEDGAVTYDALPGGGEIAIARGR